MKNIAVTLLFIAASLSVHAAGPLDGVYSCNVNILGSNVVTYIAVNGHSDGGTAFTVAAVSPSTPFYGYGIGSATATSFVGTTHFGKPFNFTANGNLGTLVGQIGIVWNGSTVTATASCSKIW